MANWTHPETDNNPLPRGCLGVTQKVRIGVVGLGKMGLSHFAMVNAHPKVETIACDGAGFMVDVL